LSGATAKQLTQLSLVSLEKLSLISDNDEVSWTVELSDEVRSWFLALKPGDRAKAQTVIDELAAKGNMLRMPLSRALGDGLFELRFGCEGVQRRITYIFEPDKNTYTLTTFRKTRQNEAGEIKRARIAKAIRDANRVRPEQTPKQRKRK